MAACPSAEELDRFLHEDLDDGAHRRVADHIGACPRCQAWLDGSTEEDIADLRRALDLPLPMAGPDVRRDGAEAAVGTNNDATTVEDSHA